MRPLIAPVLALAALLPLSRGLAQELPAPSERLLERSDAVLVSLGGSYEMELKVTIGDGRTLEYRLKDYVKDSSAQRAIFQEPAFDRDDSAIRKGAIAYFKYRDWPKYEAMNAKSSFMDSPFSWEDALSPALAGAYEAAGVAWDDSGGERLLRCELRPLRDGAYRRIVLWIRPGTYQTVRRVYYTPSGREWKTASFGGYVMEGGIASAWEMTMVDESTKASASISIGTRRPERMSDSFFEPRNGSKER
jgi:hypothetical protein